MSEEQPAQTDHRARPTSEAFRRFIASGWASETPNAPAQIAAAPWARARRDAISSTFPGDRLVIPAGGLKVRSNDTDYIFRPHSAFAHLTGLGADREPDAVLVLEPNENGHHAVLYFRPRAERDTEEFYADTRYGELWVGDRPTLAQVSTELALPTCHLDDLSAALTQKCAGHTRIVRDADPNLTSMVDSLRRDTAAHPSEECVSKDTELACALSELRLVKDEWEVDQLRLACAATASGFQRIARSLPNRQLHRRGERWLEGQFGLVARHAGNGVGYNSIVAAGAHATTLHWIRNDGDLHDGDLILIDAGVEMDSLYTADVTRTIPVSGRFTPVQRQVYDAVLDAQNAAMAAVRPGKLFRDVHQAAIEVIADRLYGWGVLPTGVDVPATLSSTGGYHRRWMVHGTSHHLGLDVHDCAQARRELYLDGELHAGMVITVEPGLYFRLDDELVPPEFRGIGVRIEDDILVTEDGYENLSSALPRSAAEIESWLAASASEPL
ncbi:MAG: aminopeptidase P family protein [Actinomycetota bacterium]